MATLQAVLDVFSTHGIVTSRQVLAVDQEATKVRKQDTTPSVKEVVDDFIKAERQYLSQLRILEEVKEALSSDVLGGDLSHKIFGPLHHIVEIQVRFLLEVESQAIQPPQEQRWSIPFETWKPASEAIVSLVAQESHKKALLRHIRKNRASGIQLEDFIRFFKIQRHRLQDYEKFLTVRSLWPNRTFHLTRSRILYPYAAMVA